ncbi:hypothetical protein [Pseudonocardia nigra]|uniref:hypothetical protein n=1 Tax=Pseudonocardia nigra TaxID=1921578 RepID=UPI001C5CE0A5|nr:hypothetical protein [Pseudonocardia nigra]
MLGEVRVHLRRAPVPVTSPAAQLWHVPGCPIGTGHLPHLRRLLARAGVAAEVRTRVVRGLRGTPLDEWVLAALATRSGPNRP